MLAGLLSADVEGMPARSSALSFVLTSKGRPLAVPRVLRLEDSVILDVSRPALPGLEDHFATYLPPRFATVEVMESVSRLSVLGPRWTDVAARLDLDVDRPRLLQDLDTEIAGGSDIVCVVREPEDGSGFDIYDWRGTARDTIAALVGELGGVEASNADHEIWRIESGIPLFGADVTAESLPQETGLVERAVSFDKGCYTGQEVVARIHYRGHVNRRLLGVMWDGTDTPHVPAPGAVLYSGDRPAGHITSSCISPRFGSIALAYVRRELDAGDRVAEGPTGSDEWIVSTVPFTSS